MSTTGWVISWRQMVVLVVAAVSAHLTVDAARPAVLSSRAFARQNIHAWAFEEYDAVPRTPAERAEVLGRIGLTRAGYVGRHVERMKDFEAYVGAYRERDIQLVAVWTPINTDTPLDEEHIRMFVDSVDRLDIRPQWWVTLEKWERVPESERIDRALRVLEPVVRAAAKRGLVLGVYGHGRDAWFTQPENQIAIVSRLRSAPGGQSVGIAYNFHHAHSHMERFGEVFERINPYLIAINVNGMRAEGPMIVSVGEGNREEEMIRLIHQSDYSGPVGILDHERKEDSVVVLGRNMAGLRRILERIGDAAAASTYRTAN